MAEGILSLQQRPITTQNLLPPFCGFNDNTFTWNTVSGGGNAVAENAPDNPMFGKGSCRITFTNTGNYVFNSGGTQMNTIAPATGKYILQYWLNKNTAEADMDFEVKVFVNGTPTSTTTFTQNVYSSSGFSDGNWNCYFSGTPLNLTAGDILTYQFTAKSDSFGSGEKLYFDGMKLERMNMNQGYLPALYTEPMPVLIETSVTIDIPSIAAGGTQTATASILGASVGQFVDLSYPAALITSGLVVGVPIVTAADTVKFVVYNPTGGAIDPASNSFKFKITE